MQCIVHGPTLKDHPENLTGPEYSTASSDGHGSICPCNTSALHAALVASLILSMIQGVGCA